jgi:hypothetical protein
MKYILERNSFNKEDIRKALNTSVKSGDIKMKMSPDEFIDDVLNKYHPEFGTFESLVKFKSITLSYQEKMHEYIHKFKELGIDTSKLEALYPKYKEYLKFPIDEPHEEDYTINYQDERYYSDEEDPTEEDWWREDEEEKAQYEKDLEEWYIDDDKHELVRNEFNTEVVRLCGIAEKIIFGE